MIRKRLNTILYSLVLLIPFNNPASATVVRMDFSLGDQSTGQVYIELFDAEAPVTVANFLNYIDDGAGNRRYDGTFLHRSYSQNIDIIQGGGFKYDPALGAFSPATAPHIDVDADNDGIDDTIINEYDPLRPNARGTIAMARLSALDSATSEWFFNVIDDSAFLPNYAVFGRVLGKGMDVLDAINNLPVENQGGAFSTLPTVNHAPATPVTEANLVILNQVIANPPARIFVDPVNLDFGFAPLNTGSANQTVTIQNIGSSNLTIGNIANLDPLDLPFVITGNTCANNPTLASLGNCQITLQFQPTAFGQFQDSFDIPSSDGTTPAVTVNVSGYGAQATPTLEVTPASSVDFGNVVLADNSTQQVTLRNIGTGNLSLLATPFAITGPDAQDFSILDVDCSNAVLALSETCTFQIQLTGTSLGTRSGRNNAITVSANDGTQTQTVQLDLNGTVVPSQADLVMPAPVGGGSTVDFGDTRFDTPIGGGIRFFNQGTEDLIFSDIRFTGADAGDFSITTTNCVRVPAQQECIETVTFTPSGTGTKSATLQVSTNDPDTPVATLSFTATSSTDNDGVPDSIESAGPNGGDGNLDGIADIEQDNVTSLPDTSGEYVTLVSDPGTHFTRVVAGENPSPDNSPRADGASLVFPYGFFSFTLENVPLRGAATVTLLLPEGRSANSYYKYNALLGFWYNFDYQEVSQTGAVFEGNRITLHFVDGGRGDHETIPNGRIVDPGGPALLSADSSSSGGGGGGGCSLSGKASQRKGPFPVDFIVLLLCLFVLRSTRRAG